jgi:hypothetical protein
MNSRRCLELGYRPKWTPFCLWLDARSVPESASSRSIEAPRDPGLAKVEFALDQDHRVRRGRPQRGRPAHCCNPRQRQCPSCLFEASSSFTAMRKRDRWSDGRARSPVRNDLGSAPFHPATHLPCQQCGTPTTAWLRLLAKGGLRDLAPIPRDSGRDTVAERLGRAGVPAVAYRAAFDAGHTAGPALPGDEELIGPSAWADPARALTIADGNATTVQRPHRPPRGGLQQESREQASVAYCQRPVSALILPEVTASLSAW